MSERSLYERLRAATRSLHDDLERAVNISERLTSRAGYADHLARLWRLHVAAEKALQKINFTPFGFVYPAPYRSELLKQDLATIGAPVDPPQRPDLPAAPLLDTVSAGLGCLYVVEGSAKGARAILPEIKQALGFDAERGATFFFGLGRESGELWRKCVGAINSLDPESADGDAAVRAASETFAMFHEGLVVAGPRAVDRSSGHRDQALPGA